MQARKSLVISSACTGQAVKCAGCDQKTWVKQVLLHLLWLDMGRLPGGLLLSAAWLCSGASSKARIKIENTSLTNEHSKASNSPATLRWVNNNNNNNEKLPSFYVPLPWARSVVAVWSWAGRLVEHYLWCSTYLWIDEIIIWITLCILQVMFNPCFPVSFLWC